MARPGLTRASHVAPELEALDVQKRAFQTLVARARSEFLIAGIALAMSQAARYWGRDVPSCEAVVESLIRSAFLQRTACGAVARVEG